MKLSCALGVHTSDLSHMGLTGRPSAASRSPCARNSATTSSAQRRASG